jgi:hypothetical protein
MPFAPPTWDWAPTNKSVWGPAGWRWLHLRAIRYPRRAPTRDDAARAFVEIWAFLSQLPCRRCREHAKAYFARNPPDLRDGPALEVWAWRFHNAVNARLGKPLVSYAEYERLYARAR